MDLNIRKNMRPLIRQLTDQLLNMDIIVEADSDYEFDVNAFISELVSFGAYDQNSLKIVTEETAGLEAIVDFEIIANVFAEFAFPSLDEWDSSAYKNIESEESIKVSMLLKFNFEPNDNRTWKLETGTILNSDKSIYVDFGFIEPDFEIWEE